MVFEKYSLVIIVVAPVRKEVHTAKGTPILVLSPVKDSDVAVVNPRNTHPCFRNCYISFFVQNIFRFCLRSHYQF